MKTRILIALVFIAFFSCSKDDDSVWQDKGFENTIKSGAHNFVIETSLESVYNYGQIEIELNNEVGKDKKSKPPVIYKMYYDSISVYQNGDYIPIVYEIENNIATFYPKASFKSEATLYVNIWASWYYKDREGTYYTNGEELFFGTEKEEFKLRVSDSDVFRTLRSFASSELDNTTYAVPKVNINYRPDEIVKIPKTYGDKYKYELEYVFETKDGNNIEVDRVVNDSLLYFSFDGVLVQNKTYNCSVTANWFVKHKTSDWLPCPAYTESIEKQFSITSDGAIDFCDRKLGFAYPLYRQCNFLIDEYSKGYFIFQDIEINKYLKSKKLLCKITDINSSDSVEMHVSFNKNMGVFIYDIPDLFLELAHIYKISFHFETNKDLLYTYHFRTSMYRSFEEKWEKEELLKYKSSWVWEMDNGYVSLRQNVLPVQEMVDVYETYSAYTNAAGKPLIQFETTIPEAWLGTKEYLMYAEMDLDFKRIKEDSYFKKFPIDAIYFRAIERLLSDENITSGEYDGKGNGHNWQWNVFGLIAYDYHNYNAEVDNKYHEYPSIFDDFDKYHFDYPPLDISYVLPGINVTTSKKENFRVGKRVVK